MKKETKKELKKIAQATPFMLPSLIGMVVFSLLPILLATGLSLTNWSGLEKFSLRTIPDNFVGFDNYAKILGSSEFWDA